MVSIRVIIAGSRDLPDYVAMHHICLTIGEHFTSSEVTEIVSGHSGAVDMAGEKWARTNDIPVKPFPYPGQYGRAGGPIRNRQMAEYADALIAIRKAHGRSNGTDNMIKEATKRNLKVITVRCEP